MRTKPDPNAKPAVVVSSWDLSVVETIKSNQYTSGFWIAKPAMASCTALGTRRLGKVSMDMLDMTDKPARCLVVPAPDGQGLYLIPGVDHPQAIDIKYVHGRAQINLVKVFTLLEKLVAGGIREFYPIEWPDHPVSFEGKEYRALIMSLTKTATKRLRPSTSKRKVQETLTPVLQAAASEHRS